MAVVNDSCTCMIVHQGEIRGLVCMFLPSEWSFSVFSGVEGTLIQRDSSWSPSVLFRVKETRIARNQPSGGVWRTEFGIDEAR